MLGTGLDGSSMSCLAPEQRVPVIPPPHYPTWNSGQEPSPRMYLKETVLTSPRFPLSAG